MKTVRDIKDAEILRRKAEALLKLKSSKTVSQLSEVESLKLIHELEVHQIELELQNEELRQAWAEAKVANEKYIGLYDLAPSGYFTLSGKGEIIELNLSGAKMLGKNRQQLKNRLFVFFVSEDSKSIFRLFLEKVFQTKSKETCEVKLATNDDIPSYVLLTGIIAENQEKCNITAVDITKRRAAQEALHESEERLREVLENSVVVSYKRNYLTNEYDYLSPGCVRITGYTVEEMKHLPIETVIALIHPDDLNNVISLLEEASVSAPGLQYHVEYRFRHKEGHYCWVHDQFTFMHDASGKPAALIGSMSDITDRKRAENDLKQTATRLALATRAGGVGIWDWDIVNNVLIWDDQMLALYGIDKENFRGAYEAWQKGLHPDDVLRGDQEIQMAIISKMEFDSEFRVLWPDGTIRYIRALAVIQRDDSGKALRMIGTNWDITAQKDAEEDLLKSQEILQKSNAEKDKFFSIISHDLRGPFNGFLGLSKMMAEDLPKLTQRQIQKMAGSMKDSAANLFRLLENLLEWSRLQRGATPFEPESFLLMPVIEGSMKPFMDSTNKKEIEISYEIPGEMEVYADEYMLASTIRNLISNAVKFTRKGGKVTIAAKPGPDHSVEISVRDTGIGMNPDLVHDLFRLDVQTNRRGTEGEPSSGLGLLLCKDFVEKHGGRIWVESGEGKGSTFCFTLPGKG